MAAPNTDRPDFLTDEQMRRALGLDKLTKGLQFVLLGRKTYHPVDGGFEAYPDDDSQAKD